MAGPFDERSKRRRFASSAQATGAQRIGVNALADYRCSGPDRTPHAYRESHRNCFYDVHMSF